MKVRTPDLEGLVVEKQEMKVRLKVKIKGKRQKLKKKDAKFELK